MGSKMKKIITPRLTMARLSRRKRRNDSWKGVRVFLGFTPTGTCSWSGPITWTVPLSVIPFSIVSGDRVVSGDITPGEASSS